MGSERYRRDTIMKEMSNDSNNCKSFVIGGILEEIKQETGAEVMAKYKTYTYADYEGISKAVKRVARIVNQVGFTEVMAQYEGKEYRMCYPVEEAIEKGIEFVDYSELDLKMTKFPIYVKFADPYVALVIDWYQTPNGVFIVTLLGYRLLKHKKDKYAKPNFDVNQIPVRVGYRDKISVTNKNRMVANLMAHNCNLDQICGYFKHDTSSFKRFNIKGLMRTKKVKEMATEQIKKTMNDMGITPESIINEFQYLVKASKVMAMEKNNPVALKVMGETLANLANYLGFNDKETKTEKRTLELTDYHEDMKQLTSETRKMKMIEEKEVED